MIRLSYLLFLSIILLGCTKEIDIEIPGFEEQLVIDGRIEPGLPPVVLLTKSHEIFATSDINAFLNSFVSGATITVSNGTDVVVLDEICTGSLPPGVDSIAAQLLGIPVDSLVNYNICAYTTLNTAVWGEVGKTYDLTVNYDGVSYTAQTQIVQPTSLDQVFWKPEDGYVTQGFSWATLSDPPNAFDAYYWEVRRLNGPDSDPMFEETYSPVIDDEFFDGLSFDFWYENPFTGDSQYPDSVRWHYALGDTVVIRFSKLDRDVYEFFEKKHMQLQTEGNPFATPTNIPTNIKGGALGIWAGFSPSYDTLICVP